METVKTPLVAVSPLPTSLPIASVSRLDTQCFDTDSQQHRVTLDGIYRIPFVSCFAPYVRVGGGLAANGSVDGLLRGGVGLEYKMERWNCSSIFIDGTYNWVNSRPNETITRIGFKINF